MRKLTDVLIWQDILGTPLDYTKAGKHTADAKIEPSDIKIVIAIIAFIITNAAKNGVEADTLSEELQQLGLPKGKRATAARRPSSCASFLSSLQHTFPQPSSVLAWT